METFGDEFFQNIAVPMKKDYSLLSSSPSTFENSTENSTFFKTIDVGCDSPVKVQLSKVLKPKNGPEMDLIGNFEKLSMFVPAKPEARLSQKRRTSQSTEKPKLKEQEVKSTPSKIPTSLSSSIRRSAGMVTRAMMAKNNEKIKPEIRRSVMRIIPTNSAPLRVSSTAQNEVRRSVAKTPIVPPRIASTPTVSRPFFANKPTRTSMLRETAAKSRPGAVMPIRGPVRISASRGLFQQTVPSTPKAKLVAEETKIELPKRPMTSSYANSLFSRLATPKTIRKPAEIKPSEVRRSVCRPIPDYIRSTQKNGLPSIGGLVGIRAPSRSRQPSGSEQ